MGATPALSIVTVPFPAHRFQKYLRESISEPFLDPKIPKSPFFNFKRNILENVLFQPLMPLKRLTKADLHYWLPLLSKLKVLLIWSTFNCNSVYLSLENLRKFLEHCYKVRKASDKNKNWQNMANQN